MKSLRRYLSLLFALVMSLNLFSITALADSDDTSKLKLHSVAYEGTLDTMGQTSIYNGGVGTGESNKFFYIQDGTYFLQNQLTFTDESDYILFEGGKEYEFRADNLWFRAFFYDYPASNTDPGQLIIDISQLQYVMGTKLIYTDGTQETIDNLKYSYNANTNCYSVSGTIKPTKDVAKLYTQVRSEIRTSVYTALKPFIGNRALLQMNAGAGMDGLKMEITVETKEQGLLKGLLGKMTDVWKSCEAGFANMVKGITDLQQNILDLPSKLWELISNGLKALFVPDADYMVSYKDKWDQLLSNALGAVYQVKEILTESWDSVMAADIQNTIEFPSATIRLPGGNSFTFGGYTVQVVPNGFTVLSTAIKTIIGIVCTIAFVNGMRKRYDEIMGVEQ